MSEKEREKNMKDVFKNVFSNSEDGKTMLYWILDQCGFFYTSVAQVKPELVAFANRLLALGDINNPVNAGILMQAFADVSKRPIRIDNNEED